jgi:hypothetical protein
VKEVSIYDGDITSFVPEEVVDFVQEKLHSKEQQMSKQQNTGNKAL